VNVGGIRNANSLLLFIDLRRINQFFQDSGNFSVWQANQALGPQNPSSPAWSKNRRRHHHFELRERHGGLCRWKQGGHRNNANHDHRRPLGPREGALALTSAPSGAVLFVDGKEIGPVASNQTVPIAAGLDEVKLKSHKYFDFSRASLQPGPD